MDSKMTRCAKLEAELFKNMRNSKNRTRDKTLSEVSALNVNIAWKDLYELNHKEQKQPN